MNRKYGNLLGCLALGLALSGNAAAEVGLCDIREPDSMQDSGSPTSQPDGSRRLENAGDSLGFWLNPPVDAGTHEVTFHLRAVSDGFYAPRVRAYYGNQPIGEVRINNQGTYQAYTFSFSNPTISSSLPVTLEYQSGAGARSVDLLTAEVHCPVVPDRPGIVCAGQVCGEGSACCSIDSDGIPTGQYFCADQCPDQTRTGAFCDGPDDCGDGAMCALTIGNQGGGLQCLTGSAEDVTEFAVAVVCGTPTEQTLSCPEGYVCERMSGGLASRLCLPE